MKTLFKLFSLTIIIVSLFSCSNDDISEDQNTDINKLFAFKIDEGCNCNYSNKIVTLDLNNGTENELVANLPMLSGLTLNHFSGELIAIANVISTSTAGTHYNEIYKINPNTGNIEITALENDSHYSNLMIKNANTVLLHKIKYNVSNQIVEVNIQTGVEIVRFNLPITFSETYIAEDKFIYLNNSNVIIGRGHYNFNLFKIDLSTNSITTISNGNFKNLTKDSNENVYVVRRNVNNFDNQIIKLNINNGNETVIGSANVAEGAFLDSFYSNDKIIFAATVNGVSPFAFKIYEFNLNNGTTVIKDLDNSTYTGSYLMNITKTN